MNACMMGIIYLFIRTAKRLLTEIVEKGRPAPAFNHNDGPGMTVQEIMVPASKAGLVIGKGGETIKSLQVGVESMETVKRRTCLPQMC